MVDVVGGVRQKRTLVKALTVIPSNSVDKAGFICAILASDQEVNRSISN